MTVPPSPSPRVLRARASLTSFRVVLLALFACVAVFSPQVAHALPLVPAEVEVCRKLLTEQDILSDHISASASEVRRLFSQHEDQARNWQKFLSGTGLSNDHVHVLQQIGIKDLNEKIWNMTGTEDYLETFHDLLHQFLRTNPALGAILHNDYKSHFIASPLAEADFKTLVLEPVEQQLIRNMQNKRPEWNWSAWVPETIVHGSGVSPAAAYFHTGLARARFLPKATELNFEQWQSQATARRAKLMALATDSNLNWQDLLTLLHKKIGKGDVAENALKRWLRIKAGRTGQTIFEELRLYRDDLQIADFHPLPDASGMPLDLDSFVAAKSASPFGSPRSNWAVERRAFFAMNRNTSAVVATDVRNLGGIARRFQDRWIARGAKLDELQSVYASSTQALEQFFAQIHRELTQIAGDAGEVRVYWSGDDAVWFLPKLSAEARKNAREVFLKLSGSVDSSDTNMELRLHASNVIELDTSKPQSDSIAEGLMRARTSLFANKKQKRGAGIAAPR